MMLMKDACDARLNQLDGLLATDAGGDNKNLTFEALFLGFQDKIQSSFPPEIHIKQNHCRAALAQYRQRL